MKTIRCVIKTVDTLHIGSGSVGLGVKKSIHIQRLNNRPFIPGSSLRGKIRANLRRLLPSLRTCAAGPLKTLLDKYTADKDVVEAIFGAPDYEGRVVVTNAILRDDSDTKRINIIPGVQLDRKSRSVEEKKLFFYEAVSPGAEFKFNVHMRGADDSSPMNPYLFLLMLALKEIEFSGLGRHRARVKITIEDMENEYKKLREGLLSC